MVSGVIYIIPLAIDPEPVGESVIEALDRVTGKARAGELSSVAIAYVTRDGSVGRTWSELPSVPAMLGSLSRLIHILNAEQDET